MTLKINFHKNASNSFHKSKINTKPKTTFKKMELLTWKSTFCLLALEKAWKWSFPWASEYGRASSIWAFSYQPRTILEKLKNEVVKRLRFKSVRSQKIAWNFFGAKNAQNQRFTFISKPRVSCKLEKICCFNLYQRSFNKNPPVNITPGKFFYTHFIQKMKT